MTSSRAYFEDLGDGYSRVLGMLIDPKTGRYVDDEAELQSAWAAMAEADAEA